MATIFVIHVLEIKKKWRIDIDNKYQAWLIRTNRYMEESIHILLLKCFTNSGVILL